MKNIFIHIKKTIIPLFGLLIISSCGDEHDFAPYTQKDINQFANVKFVHAAVEPNGVNFQINYFIGAEKISAVDVTTGLPLGTNYGSIYPTINYSLIKPGEQPLTIITPFIAATETKPEVLENTVFSGNLVTEKEKFYTNFLIATPPTVTPVVYSTYQINDDFAPADLDKTKAYIRFINVISNSAPEGYDLGIIKATSLAGDTPVVTKEIYTYKNVTFKGGDEKFIAIEAQETDDVRGYQLQLRTAGSPANMPSGPSIANQANSGNGAFVPRAGRIYTIFCRGLIKGTPKANIPAISWHTNR